MALITLFFSNYWLSLLIGFIIFYMVRYWMQRRLEPPGPICVPILGYLPFFLPKQVAPKLFMDLAKTYGDVFQINRGQQKYVVLNSAESIKVVFKRPEFSARGMTPITEIFAEAGEDRLVFANGEVWKQSKRIAQHSLGQFTSSRDSRLEMNVHKCVSWLIDEWKTEVGKPVLVKEKLTVCTAAIISSLCFGSQVDPNLPFLHELFSIMTDVFARINSSLWVTDLFPSLEVFLKTQRKGVVNAWGRFIQHVMNQMGEYQPNEKIETIADSICKATAELNKEGGSSRISMTEEEVKRICIDLYDGGFFTVTETTEWFLLLMASYPKIQKALQAEIDDVVAKNQLVCFATDRHRLPLVYSCLTEVLRWTTNVSLALPHTTLEDTTYKGFVIRKGTLVTANLWASNNDPTIFDNPREFNPRRFMNKDGTFNKLLAEELLSFGYGKRRCPGEAIAKQECFLLFVYLMQSFNVKLDPSSVEGDPLELVDTAFGLLSPKPHNLIFEARE